MERGKVPQSKLVGDKIELTCPCMVHVIYYPATLAMMGSRGNCNVFMTACECQVAYIVTNEPDAPHFRMHGDPGDIEAIGTFYEMLPWPESETEDGFSYKVAPSWDELKELLAKDAPDRKRN